MSTKLTVLVERHAEITRQYFPVICHGPVTDSLGVAGRAINHAAELEKLLRQACQMIGGDELDARQEAFISKCDEVLL